MQIALVGAAIMLFLFGLILLFKPNVEKKISDWLNKTMFPIEDKMRSSNRISGFLLIMVGIVVYMLAIKK